MRKIVKTFFSDFTDSLLPQPTFYKRLLRLPLSYSLTYFITLIFVINSIFLVLYAFRFNVKNLSRIKDAISTQAENFPRDLKIYINHGNIMTTSSRPYFFWLNEDGKNTLLGGVEENTTSDRIKQYDSLFLLTDKVLMINRVKIPPSIIGDIPTTGINTTIDREWLLSFAATFSRFFPVFVTLFFLYILLGVPVIIIIMKGGLIMLLSMIVYFLFKYFNKKHTYKKTFQLSLHAVTLPFVVMKTISFLNPAAANLDIPFILLFLIFSICALYEAYLDSEPRKIPQTLISRRRK